MSRFTFLLFPPDHLLSRQPWFKLAATGWHDGTRVDSTG